ncbi:MAG: hypothetical protein WC634_02215 [archaeon]
MPLKLTVPNYFFHLLVAFIVATFVVGAFAYVVLPGTVPDPGHALSEIQNYFQGDASLQQSLSKFCQSDGTSCPAAGGLPAGVVGQTLRHNGTNWIANSVLFNNGTNVGIGTTNPQTILDIGTGVVGSPRFQVSQVTNSFPRLYMGGSSATVSYVINKINPATTGYFGEAADAGGYQFRGTGNFYIQGNTGIGTTTPHGSLEVYGTNANAWVYFNGNANIVPNPSAGVNTGFMTAWNPSGGQGETQILYGTGLGVTPRLDFGRWSGAAKTIDMTLRNGNVGIGTASPQGALDVVSTTGAFIVPRMTTAQRNLLVPVNGMIIYNTSTNQFNFRENGAWVLK